jgi:hypothetical protein
VKSLTEHQAAFYESQPVEYRRGWWKWALDEPNFTDMTVLCREDDPSVIRYRERAIAEYRAARVK